MTQFDVVIMGGGIIGSAVAYFLARTGQAGSIAVIEPDADYTLAATPVGAGGVRQLFSQPENIWMSQYSLQFYKAFAEAMALDGRSADIDFEQRGYLFVVGDKGAKQLEANYQQQTKQGVKALLLDPAALAKRFPSLRLDDVALGCFSPEDGTLTTRLALQGFRQQAVHLGVQYMASRVTHFEVQNGRVRLAFLADGADIQGEVFVCAAGAWSSELLAMVGVPLPVVPMCRVKHYWSCETELEPLPLVKDESGLFFRPLGDAYVGGRPSWEVKPGFAFQPQNGEIRNYFEGYFERTVRPLLGNRLPAFSAAQEQQSWMGHYAQNTLDGNMILGSLGEGAQNFYVAGGFSGHGVMHAPAVGLALSELILKGRYETMDLSRMSYQRVLDDVPYAEKGIV